MSLKKFIAEENEQAEHALRYLTYFTNEHEALTKQLHIALVAVWEKIVSKIPPAESKPVVDEPTSSFIRYNAEKRKKPTRGNTVEVDIGRVKLGPTGHFRTVQPSVKIGCEYPKSQRKEFKKQLLAAAKIVFSKSANKLNGGGKEPFVVLQHDDDNDGVSEVRLLFKTGDVSKTLFIVDVADGALNDRVYFRDPSNKNN